MTFRTMQFHYKHTGTYDIVYLKCSLSLPLTTSVFFLSGGTGEGSTMYLAHTVAEKGEVLREAVR